MYRIHLTNLSSSSSSLSLSRPPSPLPRLSSPLLSFLFSLLLLLHCHLCSSAKAAQQIPENSFNLHVSMNADKINKIEAAFSVFLGSRLQYIACLARSDNEAAAARIDKAGAECVKAAAQQLSVMPALKHETAIRVLEMLDNSSLRSEHEAQLRDLVESKVSLELDAIVHAPDNATSHAKQSFLTFATYLQHGQRDSAIAFDPKTDTFTRRRALSSLARKCGCNHPTEETKALMTACAFHDCGEEDMHHLGSDFGYDMLQKFKYFLNSGVVHVGCREPLMHPTFEQLAVEHPILFHAAGFTPGVDCPLLDFHAQKTVEMIASWIPRRKSNGNVNLPTCKTIAQPRHMGKIEGVCNLPGFRMCEPRQPSSRPQDLRRCTTFEEQPAPSAGPAPSVGAPPLQPPALTKPPALEDGRAGCAPGTQPDGQMQNGEQLRLAKVENGQQSAPKASITQMIAHLQGARRAPAAKEPAKAKAKTKGNAKTKGKAKTKGNAHAKAKVVPPKATVGKPAKIPKGTDRRKQKSVHVERSVSHVLARTGLSWCPKSKAFPYKTVAGIEHAKKLAWKWLNEVCP